MKLLKMCLIAAMIFNIYLMSSVAVGLVEWRGCGFLLTLPVLFLDAPLPTLLCVSTGNISAMSKKLPNDNTITIRTMITISEY